MLDWLPADTALYGPDSPVARLEARVAELLGKQRALFFPSGTMAQQVALRVHAERLGRLTFTAHPHNHLDRWGWSASSRYCVVSSTVQPFVTRSRIVSHI